MAYTVDITKKALRDLENLPTFLRDEMLIEIKNLADNPKPPGSKTLTNVSDGFRIAVGEYRALYKIEEREQAVLVGRVEHRSNAYKKNILKYMRKLKQ